MNKSWQTLRIDSVCLKVTSGGTPSRKIPEYFVLPNSGGTPWLKTKELDDGIVGYTEEHISDAAIQDSSAKLLPTGTVAMAMYGATVGKLGILGRPMTCNQAVCAMVVDPTKADHRFLFYSLLHNRESIINLAVGSAQQNISGQVIKGLQLPFPALDEQRRIAGVLGALDDLIEVNRGLIQDLAETATTLAKQWALLASRKVILSEVADHLAGKYLAKEAYLFGGRYVVYGSNSVMGTHSTFLHEGPLTVLARIGSYCGALSFSERNAWINNNASAIRAKDPANAYWLHEALLLIDMDVHRAGSGQPFVQIESLMSTDIPWLAPAELNRANELLGSLQSAIASLREENVQLTETRDELLPLLMTGRIRVGEEIAA